MEIIVTTPFIYAEGTCAPGDIVTLDDTFASDLIAGGYANEVMQHTEPSGS
jgi:hypothetical protein